MTGTKLLESRYDVTIENATASDSGAAQFPITVDVTGKTAGLYAGSTASLAVTVKQATDVLAVNTQALHTEGDTTFVYVIDGS